MNFLTTSRRLVLIAAVLGLVHSVYPVRPSVLLKRSLLRHRLLAMPATLRPKRQLYREDIPQHRPLTGNTYYIHAGFPHPSRWHEGAQVIPPDPNPITHHHLHHKPGLHDDSRDNNNHVNHEFQNQLIHPPHQDVHHHHHHNGFSNGGNPGTFSVVNNKVPPTVNIHSSIVHGSVGGLVDNSLGNLVPQGPVSPADQANFDPLLAPYSVGPGKPSVHPPKPHSEPESYEDDYGTGGGFDSSIKDISPLGDPASHLFNPGTSPVIHHKEPQRKPKTIIHYHPVTVGNIINFNDDNKPVLVTPSPVGYGPPEHIPGVPLTQKDLNSVMLSMADPFINSPFKTVNGPPGFLEFGKDESVQYGPPQHVPGVPLGSLDFGPMLPSFGPPLKSETPPYGIALPVIAHLHNPPPPPPLHRPKHHRGKGRAKNHHHLHLHHIHHPPGPSPVQVHAPVEGPFYGVKHPSYVVRGHVPSKLISYHNPNFRSHSHSHTAHHHHHKSFWSW